MTETFFQAPGINKPVWVEISSYILLPGPAFEIWTKNIVRAKTFLDEKHQEKHRGTLKISLRTYIVIIK